MLSIQSLLGQTLPSVLFDPGHGGSTGSTSGCNGPREDELCLTYGSVMYTSIITDYRQRFITRHTDVDVTLQNRVNMANNTSGIETDAYGNPIPQGGVDFFYSIHTNASGTPSVNGTESYYYASGDFRETRSQVLCTVGLQMHLYYTMNELPIAKSRSIKDDTQSGDGEIFVLRNTMMTAALIETEFISNPTVCPIMDTFWYWIYTGFAGAETIHAMNPSYPDDIAWHFYYTDVFPASQTVNVNATQCALFRNYPGAVNGAQQYFNVQGVLNLNDGLTIIDDKLTVRPYGSGAISISGDATIILGADAEIFGTAVSISDKDLLPNKFSLFQNYPNPFNPTTTIQFGLPKSSSVNLEVYNVLGEKVRTLVEGNKSAGYHSISWDGKNDQGTGVSSGIYIYRLSVAGKFAQSKKMLLLK